MCTPLISFADHHVTLQEEEEQIKFLEDKWLESKKRNIAIGTASGVLSFTLVVIKAIKTFRLQLPVCGAHYTEDERARWQRS